MTGPYKVGDRVQVLYFDNGTRLAITRVTAIAPNIVGGWTITYASPIPGEDDRVSIVNDQGSDRHGYVIKAEA